MKIKKTLGSSVFVYDEPEVCPLCKHAIKPEELGACTFVTSSGQNMLCITSLCKSCYKAFIALYSYEPYGREYNASLLYVEPTRFKKIDFAPCVENVSPSFTRIYNQAFAAETSGLNELAGMGYRKALEFLIKDYLIHTAPDDADTVKGMELGNCIANKVSNERLRAVASRSAWLGNDQAHYVQRFQDHDIEDLKRFINASVYWISMELTTEEALSIESRRDR